VLAVLSGRLTPEAREGEGRGELAAAVQGHLPSIQSFFSGRRVTVHEHWGYVLLALVIVWLAIRLAVHLNALRRPLLAVVAGILTVVVLLITGYSGGSLVYRERGRDREGGYVVPSPLAWPSRLSAVYVKAVHFAPYGMTRY
jgi:hypothetical protein